MGRKKHRLKWKGSQDASKEASVAHERLLKSARAGRNACCALCKQTRGSLKIHKIYRDRMLTCKSCYGSYIASRQLERAAVQDEPTNWPTVQERRYAR